MRVLHRVASIDCYDAFKSAGLPQQNFAALRMTYSRFAGAPLLFGITTKFYARRGAPTKVSLVLERANGVLPYGFEEKADCLYRLCSPHPPRRARSPFSAGEGLGCAAILNVGRLSCSRRFAGKGYFTYGKPQRLLRRSPCEARVLHRVASIDCYISLENAGLPQQNFATLRMTC